MLCNFAAVRRLDLVEGLLRGRRRWTDAVAFEVSRSAGHLPDLARIAVDGWLGEPIEVADAREVDAIDGCAGRCSAAGRTSRSSISARRRPALLRNRPAVRRVDVGDQRPGSGAVRALPEIVTRETIDLVRDLVAEGDLVAETGFALLRSMAEHERRLRLPASPRDQLP